MPVLFIGGHQRGDEGKAKMTYILSPIGTIGMRLNGALNTGHEVVYEDGTNFIYKLIPVCTAYNMAGLVDAGMGIEPVSQLGEKRELERRGRMKGRLVINEQCPVTLWPHIIKDMGTEALVDEKRTSTGSGVGPCFSGWYARRGIPIGDFINLPRERVEKKFEKLRQELYGQLEAVGVLSENDFDAFQERTGKDMKYVHTLDEVYEAIGKLEGYVATTQDVQEMIEEALRRGEWIVVEAAQGALLDVRFGQYPMVSSTGCTSKSIFSQSMIPLKMDGKQTEVFVLGVAKPYSTMAGNGAFPTRMDPEMESYIREVGDEKGRRTGLDRYCGWLDLPQLRYAIKLNSTDALAINKLDILRGLDPVKICVAYRLNGREVEFKPSDDFLRQVKPMYEELPGFNEDIRGIRRDVDLPENAWEIADFISDRTGVPLASIGTGQGPRDVIVLEAGKDLFPERQ